MYDAVLMRIAEEFPEHRVVLYDVPLKPECVLGGCGEDRWADPHEIGWLTRAKSNGLVWEFCTYDLGRCARPDGEYVSGRSLLFTNLTASRSCGDGCTELYATLQKTGPSGTAIIYTRRYRLTLIDSVWTVCNAVTVKTSHVHG
jgi:hypothetical protein